MSTPAENFHLKLPRTITRPPKFRRPPTLPRGPKLYQEGKWSSIDVQGPVQPPPGFVTQQTTASEWVWYWASMKVLDPARDPRVPPFYGGSSWAYQSQQLPQIAHIYAKALSTNVDFLYQLSYPPLAVRLQSFRYHLATTSLKQQYDLAQLKRELGVFDVVDIYEQDFLEDTTGQAAIVLLKQTLGLIPTGNPLDSSTIRVIRNPFQ